MKKTQMRIENAPKFYTQYDPSIIEEAQPYCDSLLVRMGVPQLKDSSYSLHIVHSNEVNAFCALTEDGFAICLTTALLQRKGINDYIIMGYVAHEFAHGALLHHLRHKFADAQKERREKIGVGLAVAMTGAADGINSFNYGMAGMHYYPLTTPEFIDKIINIAEMETIKYTLCYAREQEFEADLIAYRFMECLGLGEEFINGLRILGATYDYLHGYDPQESDHPTISNRIAFLKFVKANPQLGSQYDIKDTAY